MARRPNTSPQTLNLLQALLSAGSDWSYGYDLSRQTGLKSGTLYPQLMRLESSGWLEAKWEEPAMSGRPARHMYRLTTQGQTLGGALLAEFKGARILSARVSRARTPVEGNT